MTTTNIQPDLANFVLDSNGHLVSINSETRSNSTSNTFLPNSNQNNENMINTESRPASRGRGSRGRGGSNVKSQGTGRKVAFRKKNQVQRAETGQHPDPPIRPTNGTTNFASSSSIPHPSQSSTTTAPQDQGRANLEMRLNNSGASNIRAVSYATGKKKRLTNRIKDELKHATLEYQKKIHELAITNEVRSEILFRWVGGFNKMKGPNRFNNYCRYGLEPRKIFASKEFPPGERMQQVGETWRALDETEQLKYNDTEFLNGLRRQIGLRQTDDPEDIEDEDRDHAAEIEAEFDQAPNSRSHVAKTKNSTVTVQQASKHGTEALKVCTKWVKRVVEELNHLRADHLVEGFVLVVSSDSMGSVFLRGGSPYGEQYMDMVKAKEDIWKKFHLWVTGMALNNELNPHVRPIKRLPQRFIMTELKPWDQGKLEDNKAAMRDQLRAMLVKARNGTKSRGWPSNARDTFKKNSLVFKIKPEAIPPPSKVNLETTLLDSDPRNFSKDQVEAVLQALHFKWITLSAAQDSDAELSGVEGHENMRNDGVDPNEIDSNE
ncbi:hypothetical protein PGT21_002297 [Puccinia graminis f. sp. tritici]|uniref:Uncharacterized protein n=1 Tax=Puccinia graminis f. sp. tritici TaxID=56615 RepID=A0A5B0QHR5_PUCGR|nr:hypothetical protein PGT21_002297 [Puccinia graminis f. sp. tritici]